MSKRSCVPAGGDLRRHPDRVLDARVARETEHQRFTISAMSSALSGIRDTSLLAGRLVLEDTVEAEGE